MQSWSEMNNVCFDVQCRHELNRNGIVHVHCMYISANRLKMPYRSALYSNHVGVGM